MKKLFFLLLLLLQPLAWASVPSYDIERSYFHDAKNQTSVDGIIEAPFEPFAGDLRMGFRQGATWIRFRLHHNDPSGKQAVATPGNPFILRVGPHTLDQIDLYENYAGSWHISRAGDRQHKSMDRCPDDLHCFSLRTDAQVPSTVYVRVQTQGMRLIETELTLQDSLALAVAPRVARISTALSLSMGLLLLGLLFFAMQRSRLLHIYCWFQVSVVLLVCASTGILAERFPATSPQTIEIMGNLIQVVRVLAMVLLGWAAVAAYQPPRAYRKLFYFLLLWCAANALLVALGYTHLGLAFNYLVLALNPLVQLYGAMHTSGNTLTLRRIIYVAYGCYLAALTLGSLVAFDLLYFSPLSGALQNLADWRLNGVAVGIFTLLYVNSEQANKKLIGLREVQALRIEAVQAKGQREILKERNTLIDVLTHELKTPLGTMRFALASLKRDLGVNPDALQRVKHIDASVKRMDSIIEHVAASVKLEETYPPRQFEAMPAEPLLAQLIEDLHGFERFKLHIDDGATFRTDRHLLLQILDNLLSNAEKYSAPGDILVSVRKTPAHSVPLQAKVDTVGSPRLIYLEICNRVAPENVPDAERLFERYYRHPNNIGIPGIGIGLHLVKVAAEHISATVHYRLEDGWVIFEVRIPN
jgi:signal transduction histidine kinase